jgi:DNA polymerase-1
MRQPMNWIGHNGTHDIRSIDTYLGYETGTRCVGETYIPAHYRDSRKQEEGGTGHALKELSIAYIARDAGKWEVALKQAFKAITIPVPGEVYKSGPRKGQQKVRRARLGEGWALIAADHPAYIAYSAADPLLTYRLWRYLQPYVRANLELYRNDLADQYIADKLHRRAMRLDVRYTEALSAAFASKAENFRAQAEEYGCANINSGKQLAEVLLSLGAELRERTPSGQYKTDDKVLRHLAQTGDKRISDFIHAVLGAKQVLKRRENYTEAFLREMDSDGRVHPSINTLAARTTRMSVSNPPLQQLPTKDREAEAA